MVGLEEWDWGRVTSQWRVWQPAGKWSWALERGRGFSERDMVRFRQDCASGLGADPSNRAGSEDGGNV